MLWGFVIPLFVILFILWLYFDYTIGINTDKIKSKIKNLFLSDKAKNIEVERTEIFSLNNWSFSDITWSWLIFLNSITTQSGIKYDYLVKSDLWMQIKTTRNGSDIHLKETNDTKWFKLVLHRTIRHLVEKEFTKEEINTIWKERFDTLLEQYVWVVFEIPKGSIKQTFDINLSK